MRDVGHRQRPHQVHRSRHLRPLAVKRCFPLPRPPRTREIYCLAATSRSPRLNRNRPGLRPVCGHHGYGALGEDSLWRGCLGKYGRAKRQETTRSEAKPACLPAWISPLASCDTLLVRQNRRFAACLLPGGGRLMGRNYSRGEAHVKRFVGIVWVAARSQARRVAGRATAASSARSRTYKPASGRMPRRCTAVASAGKCRPPSNRPSLLSADATPARAAA